MHITPATSESVFNQPACQRHSVHKTIALRRPHKCAHSSSLSNAVDINTIVRALVAMLFLLPHHLFEFPMRTFCSTRHTQMCKSIKTNKNRTKMHTITNEGNNSENILRAFLARDILLDPASSTRPTSVTKLDARRQDISQRRASSSLYSLSAKSWQARTIKFRPYHNYVSVRFVERARIYYKA